jgi:hypothetical protein
MRTTHMPMEVFRFYVERKNICQQRREGRRNIPDRIGRYIRMRRQRKIATCDQLFDGRGKLLSC